MHIMKTAWILGLSFFLLACGGKNKQVNADLVNNPATASGKAEEGKLPKFEFETVEYNFGTVTEGQIVKYTYTFKNTGNADLVITDARGSCGCTVPTYPENAIPPGGSGEISVQFDSNKRSGDQNKTVTLTANTSPTEFVLSLKGFVKTQ
jgi:hypothetical protein